ncbi:MAG TPA: hypothetical protein VIX12_09540 [Candidatus Binataceae bacterium]
MTIKQIKRAASPIARFWMNFHTASDKMSIVMASKAIGAAAVFLMFSSFALGAIAQGASIPMPDTTYPGQLPDSYTVPEPIPMPSTEADSSNVVTVPIPGGGEVNVEGPDAPKPNPAPPIGGFSPGRTTPNMPATGPMGP